MMFRRFRLLPVLLVAGLFAGLLAGPVAHADTPHIGHIDAKPAILDWEAPRSAEQTNALAVQPATGTPIQDFRTTINDGGTNFSYSMIGKNPFVAQDHAGSTVKLFLEPIVIKFSNGFTWDPT